jgi:hypothetical protein
MNKYIEEFKKVSARSSYRADQHEENEMVINTHRAWEIFAELLEKQKKEIIEGLQEFPKYEE